MSYRLSFSCTAHPPADNSNLKPDCFTQDEKDALDAAFRKYHMMGRLSQWRHMASKRCSVFFVTNNSDQKNLVMFILKNRDEGGMFQYTMDCPATKVQYKTPNFLAFLQQIDLNLREVPLVTTPKISLVLS